MTPNLIPHLLLVLHGSEPHGRRDASRTHAQQPSPGSAGKCGTQVFPLYLPVTVNTHKGRGLCLCCGDPVLRGACALRERRTRARALLGLLLSAAPGSGPGSALPSGAHPEFGICKFGGSGLHVGELTQDSSCTNGR